MGHTMMVVRRALHGTYNDGGEEGTAWDIQ